MMIRIALVRAMRGTRPGSFAIVMATGIVSIELRSSAGAGPAGAGLSWLSAVLLVVAGTAFAVLAAASAWRAVTFPAGLRDDLACAGQPFTAFAFVAACGVLAARLAVAGPRVTVAALAATALAAWVVLACRAPGWLTARPAARAATGSWYLWPVGTQSLAIAALSVRAAGLLPARPAAVAAIAAWTTGTVLYLMITALVVTRLLVTGLGPGEPTAPYWVAMGAASITVLAAATILRVSGSVLVSTARHVISGLTVTFWALATCLILPLAARGLWRHLRGHAPLRYRPDLWMIVFPAGMYATASLRLAAPAGLPLAGRFGAAAAWPATAAWALTFAAMIVTALIRARPGAPGNLYRATMFIVPIAAPGVMQVYVFQAMITLDRSAPGRPAALPSGRACRRTLCGQHSQTGASKFFSAMVADNGESTPGQADEHAIVTVAIPGPDAAEYFGTGAEFTVWLGGDIARGVVTRRRVVWPLTA